MRTRILPISLLLLAACGGLPERSGGPAGAKPTPNRLSDAERAAGWRLLFDGRTTTCWRGYRKDAFPDEGWVVEDGCLHVQAGGGGGDIVTEESFDDFELALEWKVSEGANSGIMYRVGELAGASWQTGPEYQILDDGPQPRMESTAAGGLYALYAPEHKVLHPAGTFNRARIVVCGNHVEHWLNGEQILSAEMHTDEWYRRVGESKFGSMPLFGTVGRGHIALQDHGNDVWYRDIKIRPLTRLARASGPPVMLFNGRDLEGWAAYLDGDARPEDVWRCERGVLICAGEPAGYIRTERDYTDFVLELDWRFDPVTRKAGNSGVLLRMVGEDKIWPESIEAQLLSEHAGDFWNIGEVAMKTASDRQNGRNTRHVRANEHPVGEWNHYRITVCGGKVELEVNGELVNEAWQCEHRPGRICLQSEGAEIHFRNIVLTPLAAE